MTDDASGAVGRLPNACSSRGRRRGGPKFICTADGPPTPSSANPVEKRRGKRATRRRRERWLPKDGSTPDTGVITLNVHFMGGTAADQKRVWLVASEWLRGGLEKKIWFVFGTSHSRSQIRVTFNPKESSTSKVGALALKVPQSEPTMNRGEVSRRAILHEFGHTLGLRHEQHHPNAPIKWGRGFTQSEAEAYAENNVFPRFDESSSCGDFDPHSVMLYPVEKAWTRNGFSSKLNQTISRGDLSCLARTYGV